MGFNSGLKGLICTSLPVPLTFSILQHVLLCYTLCPEDASSKSFRNISNQPQDQTRRSYNRCRAAHNLPITSHQVVHLVHGIYSRDDETLAAVPTYELAHVIPTSESEPVPQKDHSFPQLSSMYSLCVHPDYVCLSIVFPSLVSFSTFLSLFL
jgi:hypothetical protein